MTVVQSFELDFDLDLHWQIIKKELIGVSHFCQLSTFIVFYFHFNLHKTSNMVKGNEA